MTEKFENMPPSQEQGPIKPEEKTEQENGFDDLVAFAEEQTAEKLPAEEELKLKVAEQEEIKKEQSAEELQLEKGTMSALNSGKTHYLELAKPEEYQKAKEEDQKRHDDLIRQKGYGALRDEPNSPFMDLNKISEGKSWAELPGFGGWMQVEVPKSAKEYLPNMVRAYTGFVEKWNNEDDEYISLLKEGKRKVVYGTGITKNGRSPEETAKEIDFYEKRKQERTEMLNLFIKKQAEGFGKIALENGDLLVALDGLDTAGILENPEITSQLKEQMMTLKNSGSTEDKIKLRKVAEQLLAIKSNKQRENSK
jgi:hypothetical protein